MNKEKIKYFDKFNKSKTSLLIITILFILTIVATSVSIYFYNIERYKKNYIKNFQSVLNYVDKERNIFEDNNIDYDAKKVEWNKKEQELKDLNMAEPNYRYLLNYTIGKKIYFNDKQLSNKKNKLNFIVTIRIANRTNSDIEINLDNINIYVNPYISKDEKKTYKNKFIKNSKNTLVNKKEYNSEKKVKIKKQGILEISMLIENISIEDNNNIYVDIDRDFNNMDPIQLKLNLSQKGLRNIYDR